jgi:hypothetical protein
MDKSELLSRWSDLESGGGHDAARKVSRRLSILSFAIYILTACIGLYLSPLSSLFVIPGILIGYLKAERNALDERVKQWPIFRDYIDWSKVRQDLKTTS